MDVGCVGGGDCVDEADCVEGDCIDTCVDDVCADD